ncbi:hypothetical protein F5Y04DRAFT_35777 [Hypomontagnella monticulosa]|nr:hypothetical protein F5Y04DRAFT_35777 [Hypomontagnella monticulosa]
MPLDHKPPFRKKPATATRSHYHRKPCPLPTAYAYPYSFVHTRKPTRERQSGLYLAQFKHPRLIVVETRGRGLRNPLRLRFNPCHLCVFGLLFFSSFYETTTTAAAAAVATTRTVFSPQIPCRSPSQISLFFFPSSPRFINEKGPTWTPQH